MQKSAVLTFSAHDKDALLDEFREIVAAGELRSRTDTRWDSACDRLSDRYGWHLDDWKRIGRDQMGQKCNSDRGWYGLKGACKRGKKGGDNKSAIRESKQALAAKLRKKKGASEIKDRDGKNNPVTYAFIPGNQKSSTAAARRTGPKSGVSSGGRLGNIQRTEEKRQQIRSGVFPGKTITERFEQADRIRDKYGGMLTPKTKGAAYLSDPRTSNLMRTHEGVREIAEAIDLNGGWVDTGTHTAKTAQSGSIRLGKVRVKKLNPPSAGNPLGSVTVEVDYGSQYGKQTQNMPLPKFADGVKQNSREQVGLLPRGGSVTPNASSTDRYAGLSTEDRVKQALKDQKAKIAEIKKRQKTEKLKPTEYELGASKNYEERKTLESGVRSGKVGAEEYLTASGVGKKTIDEYRRVGALDPSYEYYFPSEADGSRQGLKVADVERKAFKRFQLLKKGLAEPADDIATDIGKKRLEQIGKLTQIEAAKQNADRRRVVSRAEIDNAPVRSTNERSSKQPRKRGRSVD